MERNLLQQENAKICQDNCVQERRKYNLRKRKPLPTKTSKVPYICHRLYKRKNPIMHMPTEILFKIFSFLSYEELAISVRLVNKRFRTLAQYMLNHNFNRIEERLMDVKKMIVNSIHHMQNDNEIKCMCKMLGSLELLVFYHSVIRSTLWRYVYLQKPILNICMYGGSILDLYAIVLRQFVTEPHVIYSPAILRDYALSREVMKICETSKSFALYFDRVSEMPANYNEFCSGSKILDILDSATNVERTVISQKLSGNTLILKLQYYFCNSWFVAFDIPDEKYKMWNEEQRVMYMRLRRIVISHTEMTMEYNQYRRETMVRTEPTVRIKKPINSVYTGYGEVGETFFYYGVMNEGAYLSKFDEDALQDVNVPFLGLRISVELRCPLQLAPWKIIEFYEKSSAELGNTIILSNKKRPRGLFELKADFECLGAKYPRLPSNYYYYLRHRK